MVFSSAIKRWFIISLSFFGGLVLMFLQLPLGLNWLGSLWVVLILLYWALMMPQYINVGAATCIGIFLDIVYNTTIGTHSLGLVFVVFCIIKFRQKILPLGFLKTALVIFCLISIYQILLFLIQVYTGNYCDIWSILGGAMVSALVWPPLALLLFNCQRKFRI
ncbi:MAG: rod shape-determining protein MreD, partial [Gammaproteobacteria bacterium]|nr:rod shape-determining protein MreD [Gammaproteobacteria bacterium]